MRYNTKGTFCDFSPGSPLVAARGLTLDPGVDAVRIEELQAADPDISPILHMVDNDKSSHPLRQKIPQPSQQVATTP